MPLQPNGHGLAEGAAGPGSLTPAQHVQQREPSKITGLASSISFVSPPRQSAGLRSGTIDAFVKICQRWHLSTDLQIVLLGYKGCASFGSQILNGYLLSSPQDVLDRVGYILAISLGLGFLFDNSERAELAWLNAPRESLNGSSPLAYMLEGRMENLMNVAAMVAHERGL
jgi:Protein of unknown function (DUF2384)